MKFVINIEPTAQMRARNSAKNGFAVTHKDKKQKGREETIKAFLAKHQPAAPMEGPLLLGVRAYLPISKSKPDWFKGKPREFQMAARSGLLRPIKKPDMDNMVKQIKDCLTQMRFWNDDCQVVGYLPNTGKYYSDMPRWEIEIVQWRPAGGLI